MARLSTAARYQEELERKEFYLINTKIEQIATGLGLTAIGPTNFLDKEHVTWLAEYLSRLPNAFLAVSHDYDFLGKISTRICDIDNEKITKFFKRQSCRNL